GGGAGVRAHGPRARGRHGEGRIVHADRQAVAPPPSVHLGVDVFAAVGTPVHAPLAGAVRRSAERELVLDTDGWLVRLAGIHPHAAGRGEAGGAGRAPAGAGGGPAPPGPAPITPARLPPAPRPARPPPAAPGAPRSPPPAA